MPEEVVPTPAESCHRQWVPEFGFCHVGDRVQDEKLSDASCPQNDERSFQNSSSLQFPEVAQARAEGDVERETRAWKLFLLAPRMLLTRPPRGGKVSRAKLVERCAAFARGEWIHLIKMCRADASGNTATSRRRRRDTGDDLTKRAKKALQLAQWGELSTARQALEGAAVAQGNERTLAQLTDPARRPELPRAPIPREFMEHNPHEQVELCGEVLLKNLRSSRRGAAGGPSSMIGEHLRVILDSESDSEALTAFARTLAVGEVPHEIVKAIRLGRMTALRKPDGGVRGIVVGDFLRRLVARTLAQQFSKAVLEATTPFQFALSTKQELRP